MITATVRGKIKFPKFNFQNDLMVIAQRIVIPLMAQGIESNRDIEGKAFPPNELATIKRKKSDSPLIDTGTLRSSFKHKRRGKSAVVVYLNQSRAKIGKYLQIDGIRSKRGKKYFNFFGITEGMSANAMSYMRNKIWKAIKRA